MKGYSTNASALLQWHKFCNKRRDVFPWNETPACTPEHSVTTPLLIIIAIVGYIVAFIFWTKSNQQKEEKPQAKPPQPQQRGPSLNDVHELFDSAHPVMPRTLLRSPAERSAWLWLRHDVFPKHNVLPKMPFTRFTLLRDPAMSKKWFEVLSGMYCTFTICSDAGLAIGCVDLLAAGEEKRSSVGLKRRLLEQCGMHYRVITIGHLPDAHELCVEFLGEEDVPTQPPAQEARNERIEAAREQLHRRLEESRRRRAAADSGFIPTDWGNQDSVLSEPEDDELLE